MDRIGSVQGGSAFYVVWEKNGELWTEIKHGQNTVDCSYILGGFKCLEV